MLKIVVFILHHFDSVILPATESTLLFEKSSGRSVDPVAKKLWLNTYHGIEIIAPLHSLSH